MSIIIDGQARLQAALRVKQEEIATRDLSPLEQAREILRRSVLRLSQPRKWAKNTEVRWNGPLRSTVLWDSPLDEVISILDNPELVKDACKNAKMCAIGTIKYEAWLLGWDPEIALGLLAHEIDPRYDIELQCVPADGIDGEAFFTTEEVITIFNDASQRQKKQVLKKFRKAAGLA